MQPPEDNPIGGSTGAMDVPSMFPSNYLETLTIMTWVALLEKKIWVKYFEVNKEFTPKKEALSFTDVSNLVYCEEYQINNIATYDDHFNAFLKVYLPKI